MFAFQNNHHRNNHIHSFLQVQHLVVCSVHFACEPKRLYKLLSLNHKPNICVCLWNFFILKKFLHKSNNQMDYGFIKTIYCFDQQPLFFVGPTLCLQKYYFQLNLPMFQNNKLGLSCTKLRGSLNFSGLD